MKIKSMHCEILQNTLEGKLPPVKQLHELRMFALHHYITELEEFMQEIFDKETWGVIKSFIAFDSIHWVYPQDDVLNNEIISKYYQPVEKYLSKATLANLKDLEDKLIQNAWIKSVSFSKNVNRRAYSQTLNSYSCLFTFKIFTMAQHILSRCPEISINDIAHLKQSVKSAIADRITARLETFIKLTEQYFVEITSEEFHQERVVWDYKELKFENHTLLDIADMQTKKYHERPLDLF